MPPSLDALSVNMQWSFIFTSSLFLSGNIGLPRYQLILFLSFAWGECWRPLTLTPCLGLHCRLHQHSLPLFSFTILGALIYVGNGICVGQACLPLAYCFNKNLSPVLSPVAVKALFDIEMLDFMDFEIFPPYLFWQVFEHRLQKIDMLEMNLQTLS